MSLLFQSGKIGNIKTKNRFVASATVECLTDENNRLTEKYYKVYERLARNNVGLIIPGNYFVNRMGRAVDKILVIDRDKVIDDLKRLTELVHKYGTKMVAQINHGGRQCPPSLIKEKPVAPSAVRDTLSGIQPRALKENEIEEIIGDFARAAKRVQKAGFDGVQINGGHGYLINEFLSERTNKRRDKWGGSLDNRMRFISEIYTAIRKEVGDHFPLMIKINADDQMPRGTTIEESITISKKLEEMGFDAIEVSGGIKETGFATTKGDVPHDLILGNLGFFKRMFYPLFKKKLEKAARFQEGYYLSFAALIKKNVSIPIMAVGGMRKKETMENALAKGDADFVSLSRPFIRQPNLISVMEKDALADPITCTNCNRCTYEITVNYKPLRCYYKPKRKSLRAT